MDNGALIISLDFELHWGVFRTVTPDSPYMINIYNSPVVIDKILEIFKRRNISATWAVVGMLFAESREMIEKFTPATKPSYEKSEHNPYLLKIGMNEIEDPIHFAPSIIKKIQSVPNQEIATHTFSHFISRENGATISAFLSDIDSALRIAQMYGIGIRSIVFPKNRLIREYLEVLPETGINVYRGAEKGWMYNKICSIHDRKPMRIRELLNKIGRLADTYLPITGSNTWGMEELLVQPGKATNVPASHFIRPYNPVLKYIEWVKFIRVRSQIEFAARNGRMVHIRWYPHNFGANLDKNIIMLNEILDCFEKCRLRYNMKSMTMSDFADSLAGASVVQ